MVDDEVADSAVFDLLAGAGIQLAELLHQKLEVCPVLDRIGIGTLDGFVGIRGHDLQRPGRGPDVRIHSMGMVMTGFRGIAGCFAGGRGVGAGTFDQFYTPAQVNDFRTILNPGEQRGFEIDQTDVKDHAGLIKFHDLFGGWFEGFGARTGRDKNFDMESLSDNPFDDAFQGQNRYVEGLIVGFRFRSA